MLKQGQGGKISASHQQYAVNLMVNQHCHLDNPMRRLSFYHFEEPQYLTVHIQIEAFPKTGRFLPLFARC